MKNPLLQSLEGQSTDIFQLAADIRAGKVNPKDKVLSMLRSNPQLKASVQSAMPKITAIARQLGISDTEIRAFKAEAGI